MCNKWQLTRSSGNCSARSSKKFLLMTSKVMFRMFTLSSIPSIDIVSIFQRSFSLIVSNRIAFDEGNKSGPVKFSCTNASKQATAKPSFVSLSKLSIPLVRNALNSSLSIISVHLPELIFVKISSCDPLETKTEFNETPCYCRSL